MAPQRWVSSGGPMAYGEFQASVFTQSKCKMNERGPRMGGGRCGMRSPKSRQLGPRLVKNGNRHAKLKRVDETLQLENYEKRMQTAPDRMFAHIVCLQLYIEISSTPVWLVQSGKHREFSEVSP